MRTKFERNPDLFTLPILSAEFPNNCRDEAPKLLKGLQAIFINDQINEAVFSLLSKEINPKQKKLVKSGRKGMGLWEILVLGVMRQGLNTNYDRIHYLANTDMTMRTVMGIETDSRLDKKKYGLTTIKDNIALLDEQTIQQVNDIVINYGHSLLKKKEEEPLRVKADSFPVGANVHFPTDMNLLWDSARKCIDIAEWFRENENITGWRKSKSWKREIKSIFRASSKASSSGGKNKEIRLHYVVTQYLQLCKKLEGKVNDLLLSRAVSYSSVLALTKHLQLVYFHDMLIKHIGLVERRILNGEVIDASEKLYSIFETHSQWLSKGKKFNPVEIGHNVLIATDQFNFIIHHQVIENQVDVQLTQDITTKLMEKFPGLIESLSFDKGFYSQQNKEFVEKIIPMTVMPKKGKRNKAETQREHEARFIKLRNAHSAVESNINQLEHNGLGRCPDKGIKNFKRYTALSVLAYNLHKLGEYITRGQILKKAA